MFSNLTERLQGVFQRLRGRGKLTEADVDEALREVRLALLEADVNFKVARDFIGRVRERAVGQDVMKSLSPAQQVIKIVNDELTALMGGQRADLELGDRRPAVILMMGLQGSGKTTTAGKLARRLHQRGMRPLLVAADVYRPAAIKQLQVLGEQVGVPVFSLGEQADPVDIARQAVAAAERDGRNVVIIDTAGRLQIDEALMEELANVRDAVNPAESLLVVDAMTGQEAVRVAETFNERIGITGVVLTKLDGDARGGAALSVRAVTGRPIKFVGVGEKLDALEPFHPDRMASRILGMGDVLTLIEKAQATMDAEKAVEMAERLRQAEFNLEDFLSQLQQMRNMGPLDQLLGMIPGFSSLKQLKNLQVDERELKRVEAIIQSMTPQERRHPHIIDGSRRRRIAAGSGTTVQDVNRLLKQFDQTRTLMKQLTGGGGRKGRGKRKGRGLFGRMLPL